MLPELIIYPLDLGLMINIKHFDFLQRLIPTLSSNHLQTFHIIIKEIIILSFIEILHSLLATINQLEVLLDHLHLFLVDSISMISIGLVIS